MKADQALAILSEVNPVPDGIRFDKTRHDSIAFLSATKERNENMDTLEREPYEQARKTERGSGQRWKPVYTVATLLVIIAFGVAVVAALQSEPDVADIPAPPFDTPEKAAEAYFATQVSGDYDDYQELFAPDALDRKLGDLRVVSAEKIETRFRWYSTYSGSVDDVRCEHQTTNAAICSFAVKDGREDDFGRPASFDVTQTFVIDDQGRLTSVSTRDRTFPEELHAELLAFEDWLAAQHPELASEIRQGVFGTDDLTRPIEEIIADNDAAIEQYADTLAN